MDVQGTLIGIYFIAFFIIAEGQDTYLANFKFKGAGPNILKITLIYNTFNKIFGFIFLVLTGFKVYWYYPILLIIFAFLVNLLLERYLKIFRFDAYLHMIGIVGIPVFVFLMLITLF